MVFKKIIMENFKGYRNKLVDFCDGSNVVTGINKSGKTSIVDAYLWCLTGKNTEGESEFDFRSLWSDAESETSVEVVFDSVSFCRRVKDNWVSVRGRSEPVYKGDTYVYEVDGVSVKKKDFENARDEFFSLDKFNTLTSVSYFPKLHWKKQREILVKLIGGVDEEELLKAEQFQELEKKDRQTVEEYLTVIKSSIKKVDNDLKELPIRIDEVRKNTPEKPTESVKDLEKSINVLVSEIAELKDNSDDGTANKISKLSNEIDEKQNKINSLLLSIEKKEQEKRKKIDEIRAGIVDKFKAKFETLEKESAELLISLADNGREVDDTNYQIRHIERNIDSERDEVKRNKEKLFVCRKRWIELDKTEVENTVCYTCKQPLPYHTIDEIRKEKAIELDQIKAEGESYNQKIAESEKKIVELEGDIASLIKEITILKEVKDNIVKRRDEINDVSYALRDEQRHAVDNCEEMEVVEDEFNIFKTGVESKIVTSQEHCKLLSAKIDNLQSSNSLVESANDGEIQARESAISQLNSLIADHKEIDKSEKRIKELKQEKKGLAELFQHLFKQQTICEQFFDYVSNYVSEKLKGFFSNVNFQLFKKLKNGGLEPTCIVLDKEGVPYKSLNNAGQIQIGLEIIKVLQKYYDKTLPIFIDNAEGVNSIENFGQQIRMYVIGNEKLAGKITKL